MVQSMYTYIHTHIYIYICIDILSHLSRKTHDNPGTRSCCRMLWHRHASAIECHHLHPILPEMKRCKMCKAKRTFISCAVLQLAFDEGNPDVRRRDQWNPTNLAIVKSFANLSQLLCMCKRVDCVTSFHFISANFRHVPWCTAVSACSTLPVTASDRQGKLMKWRAVDFDSFVLYGVFYSTWHLIWIAISLLAIESLLE